jgi:thioredoxin-like negative regulator of GroEL
MTESAQGIDFELASPEIVANSEQGMLLFHKPRCPNCMVMRKVAQKSLAANSEMNIAGIDIEAHPDVQDSYQINRVPTLVVFKAGQETGRKSGVMKPQELTSLYFGS